MCLQNDRAYSQIFNVAGPELLSCDEYIDTIAKLLDVKLLPLRLPISIFMIGAAFSEWIAKAFHTRPFFTRSQIEFLTEDHGTGISKIRNLLGFTPAIDLENGMQKTLTWVKEQNLL
jgi:nucleoside-diphosphate-sugar epimerase